MFVAPLLIALLLAPVWLVWVAMFLVSDPVEEISQVKRHQFLAPGGPDDPFAGNPVDDE